MMRFAFQCYDRKFTKPFLTAHGEWSVRSGLIIAITDENGILRIAEIAPLPWFGTETIEEAIEFCTSLGHEFDQATVPNSLPCCQFAFEVAQTDSLIKPEVENIAGLLSAGETALEQWQDLYAGGTRSFKWKIATTDIEAELQIFQQLSKALPKDVKLRLDANAGLSLTEAKQWLEECDRRDNIEYLEQPLAVDQFDSMLQLSQTYKTTIALDESIATYDQLEDCYNQGWRGIFVVKPTIAGPPSQLKEFCKNHTVDLVFSSVFETPIGRAAGLKLAQELGNQRALGYGTDRFFDPTISNSIGILESDPGKFLVKFWQARVENRSIFLGNPLWGKSDFEQFDYLIKTERFTQPNICIPTGGTSGKLKFAVHTWETLAESVTGMQKHFEIQHINSFCTLPLYHVSGLMQYFRSHLTQGQFVIWNWKELEQGHFPNLDFSKFFISLVPTQLQRLLHQPKLQQFKTILLGGAPAWESLLITARELELPIALTYGMTEMASQVTTLLPHEFLAGQTNSGKPLPHVKLQILDDQNQICEPEQIGHLQIQSRSQMLGYRSAEPELCREILDFKPDDLGYLDTHGYLHIVGRSSDKIISGGENIYPAEVEALILAIGDFQDVCVIGLPDDVWGQRVVAIYHQPESPPSLQFWGKLKQQWQGSPTQFPKQWIGLPELPRNAQGKIDRSKLIQLTTEN